MIRPVDDIQVSLCRDVVDMRKSINDLSILVEQALGIDPFEPRLFVFCNPKRDKITIRYRERAGFVLWHKRLEKNRFAWPLSTDGEIVTLTDRKLNWLLAGIDVFAMQPHEEVSFERVL